MVSAMAGTHNTAAEERLEDKLTEKLLEQVNASAATLRANLITFLATISYVVVATLSTSHADILLGKGITLPLINAGIPIPYFAFAAGVLLLILHGSLLGQHYSLAVRLHRLEKRVVTDPQDSSQGAQLQSLLTSGMTIRRLSRGPDLPPLQSLLLRLSHVTVYCVAPVLCQTWLILFFLPCHDQMLLGVQKGLTLFNVFLVVLLIPASMDLQGSAKNWWKNFVVLMFLQGRSIRRTVWWLFVAIGLPSFCLTVLFCIQIPGACTRTEGIDGILRSLGLPRYFDVRNQILARGDEKDLMVLRNSTMEGAKALDISDRVIGTDLTDRDLRCADFRGATLVNADFSGSELQGATFDDAVLIGASFFPKWEVFSQRSLKTLRASLGETDRLIAELRDSEDEIRSVEKVSQLLGASFVRADLRSANFSFSKAPSVDLRGARLDGAIFFAADLKNARLDSVVGKGVIFQRAVLDISSLKNACLPGADLTDSSAHGVNFARSMLCDSTFERANLKAVSFLESDLGGVPKLDVEDVDLRHARLDLGCWPFNLPRRADLRGVQPVPATLNERLSRFSVCRSLMLESIQDGKEFCRSTPIADDCSARDAPVRGSTLLFSSSGRPTDNVEQVYSEIIQALSDPGPIPARGTILARHGARLQTPSNPDFQAAVEASKKDWLETIDSDEVCAHRKDREKEDCKQALANWIATQVP
jgi:uncharacterized protein YjbI with pentapeptide repeats